ncbi:MAG: head-tail adaptor protein [Herbinix sp.]|nr:head-tail adaptor protein [Herbinix sp.]
MNPGELNERIAVLEFLINENVYKWMKVSAIWAKSEQLSSNNIFSTVGIGAKSIKFTIRKNKTLTLHNAFTWHGKHCFITNINEIDSMYYEVTAALAEPKSCLVSREAKPTKNELNRPVYGVPEIITFYGCLVEKYIGHNQGDPMSTIEIRYVLVTPKSIELKVGEIVTIDSTGYTVLITHALDEYKNEYEIKAEEDV